METAYRITKKVRKRGYSGTQDTTVSSREEYGRRISEKAAEEGMVLLENNGILPLIDKRIALYGDGVRHTIIGGTGSGSVNNRGNVSLEEGMKNAGFIITNEDWLENYEEACRKQREVWMNRIYELSEKDDPDSLYRVHAQNRMKPVKGEKIVRAADTRTAVYVISRICGEGADRKAVKGDYYLSDEEEEMLTEISTAYPHLIILLNVGGVMSLDFLDRWKADAVLLMGQGGMESGNAAAAILSGRVNPSGRLTDTWAEKYEDYPGSAEFSHNNDNLFEEYYKEGIYVGYRYFDTFRIKPRYPFGYGLSYTTFEQNPVDISLEGKELRVGIQVKNTGRCAGKEVVQLYASCPDGILTKETKRLVGFAKTSLLQSGEEAALWISFPLQALASYHSGKEAYILDQGKYVLLYGKCSDQVTPCARLTLERTLYSSEYSSICPLLSALPEIEPEKKVREEAWETADVPEIILPEDIFRQKETEKKEEDPQEKLYEQIAGQLSVEEAARLVCGEPGDRRGEFIGASARNVPGAAAETTSCLVEKYGIMNVVLADGPAGIRLLQRYEVNPENGQVYYLNRYQSLENRFFHKEFYHTGAKTYYQYCTAIPVGTMLAQTFNTKLLEEVGEMMGRELDEFGITLWLAPGMNIHRNPLCGRNFEYYSEDPLLSGKMAAAITRGVQKVHGVGTTIKHFACNNQEENRFGVSSVVSERALREIYLKGFEIAVKEAQPMAIMTSYNKVNGVHSANNYDLCTKVAREEWGFQGIIMTDWTTTNHGGGSSAAKCMEAGNDMIMPGSESDVKEIVEAVQGTGKQHIEEKYLRECAARVIRMIASSNAYEQ